jgi:Rieske Fe-S protein
MSLICTHAGCDISVRGSVSAQGVVCYCHGSTFDANGNVLGGPASGPLEHFAVSLDAAGQITIDTNTTVLESTRTAA